MCWEQRKQMVPFDAGGDLPHLSACDWIYLQTGNKRRLSASVCKSGNTAALFELTFFSRQCVKGCRWHFTLIHLKRWAKPYSFIWRQVNTWTWRSFSFRAVLKFLIPRDLFIREVMVLWCNIAPLWAHWWISVLVILCDACQPDYADQR